LNVFDLENFMKKQTLTSSLVLAALLAGCSMIPDYARPDMTVPAGWSEQHGAQATPTTIAKDWWKSFNSAELNALMDEALANNNDLGAAIQRVEQARATLRRSRASLLPSVDGTGSATYVDREVEDGPDTSDTGGSLGLAVAYELDLFGQNRAEIESGKATLESQAFARDATSLIVMADVAKGYFNVLNLQERLLIADQNLESARQLLRIVQARYDAGATTLLDVAQQKSDLASTEAARALVEQELAIARSSLAILLGRPPQNFGLKEKDLRGLVIPAIAPAQPSTLLERRPDIRSKEYELIAANADIGAARAAFFPSITLGLDAGLSLDDWAKCSGTHFQGRIA
jgi:outer membrane protein, multidrug efflux system